MKKITTLLFVGFSVWGIRSFGQDTTKTPDVNNLSAKMWWQLQSTIDTIAHERNYWYVKYHDLRDSLNKPDYIRGYNIHPFNNSTYSDYQGTLNKLKQAGANAVRFDLHPNSQGIITDTASYNKFMSVFRSSGLTLMPMFSVSNLNLGYSAGVIYGKNAASYGFKYLEIANEVDNILIKSGDGQKVTDYDTVKLAQTSETFRGISDGIKAYSKATKIIIDVAWVHHAWIRYLSDHGVNFDIVAQHWYVQQNKAWKGLPIEQLLVKNFPDYQYIFNETGLDNTGTVSDSDVTMFADMLNRFKNVVIYELQDEQARKNSKEGFFGIYNADGSLKPWFSKLPK